MRKFIEIGKDDVLFVVREGSSEIIGQFILNSKGQLKPATFHAHIGAYVDADEFEVKAAPGDGWVVTKGAKVSAWN